METAIGKRLLGRTRAIMALGAGVALIPLWLALPRAWRITRGIERGFHRLVVKGHGMDVRVHGAPLRQGGRLFVVNHVSWIDISVLASVLDVAFVAKDDVAEWPFVGALARRCGTVFVARDRPRDAAAQQQELALRLSQDGVILFPEGTTSTGPGLAPFRTSLFAAAASAMLVQPVTLVYGRRDGGRLSAAERRTVAWIDDDALLPHAMQLARAKGLCVDVHFEQPVAVTDRKLLAQLCRQRILDRLLAADQAAAMNRVA